MEVILDRMIPGVPSTLLSTVQVHLLTRISLVTVHFLQSVSINSFQN